MSKERLRCYHCKDEMKGCKCRMRKASDGNLVHGTCLNQYNRKLEILKKEKDGKK